MSAPDALARAAALRASGTPFVLATVIAAYPPQSARPGAKAIVHADGTIEGWFGGGCVRPVVLQEAAAALEDGEARLVRLNAQPGSTPHPGRWVREYPMTCQGEGGLEVYLEPVFPAPRLVVLGATPVAQSLARLGRELEFDVVVAARGVARESFPDAGHVDDDPWTATAALDASSDVVVATMGAGDEEALEAAVASGAGYVGLVASRKKAQFLLEYLGGLGVDAERLKRVKAPAGLDLGGMRAPEIALSVMAEIVARRHGARRAVDAGRGGEPGGPPRQHDDTEAGHARHPTDPAGTASSHVPVDPVCGMPVDPATARHTSIVDGHTVYFCCPHCKAAFDTRAAGSG